MSDRVWAGLNGRSPQRFRRFGRALLLILVPMFWLAGVTSPSDAQPPEQPTATDTSTSAPTPTSTPTSAPASVDDSEESLQESIQILRVTQADGLVTMDVAVPPAIGRLTPVAENFGVTDGGQLVDATVTSIGASADTVLVIDTSGSMQGPALASATSAAAGFVRSLPDDVKVGLISFGETVITHTEPTGDRGAVLAELDSLTASGQETALWDALLVAAEIAGAAESGASSVVVLSDGDDTASAAPPAAVVDAFADSSAVLYAVAIETADTNLGALEQVADQIGGQFLAATNLAQLDALYADISGRLVSRYRLRFVPAAEGSRTVVVSVAAVNGVAVASTTLVGPSGPAGTSPPTTTSGPAPVINVDEALSLGPAVPVSLGPLSGRLLLLFGLGCMFAALTLAGIVMARPAAKVRLNAASGGDRLKGANVRLGDAVDQVITDYDRGRRIDARLEAADINLRPGEFLLAWLLITVVIALSVLAMFGPIYSVLVAVVSALASFTFLNFRTNRRRSAFADQLTETLGIMASSLRSGQSLPRSIELVAAEAPSPTAEEFHRISFEIRVGRDLTDSILESARRMDSPDLEWLAQAVDINRELGGDLTEILDNVAGTIRERRTVARQINALSSEGRATGWVLLGLPVALFFFSWWRTPANIEALFTEPVGRVLVAIALSGMSVGHVWIRRLVRLKF
jgi:tight adherence protein B